VRQDGGGVPPCSAREFGAAKRASAHARTGARRPLRVLALRTPAGSCAQWKRSSTMIQQQTVSLDDARRIITAAEDKAREIGQPMNIAVVDDGGNLVAFAHMDGSWKGSVDIAVNKAFTSAMFTLPTKGLAKKAQPGEPFYGIHVSNHGRVMIFPGGIPLKAGDQVIGAVGVSGGDNSQDQSVAEAAVDAL
jgi:uncharacterized protein GlcG (DUF336 family)